MTKLISENLQSGLVVQGLRKSYQKKTIIQDVSLSVKRGEVVACLARMVQAKLHLSMQ